MLSTLRECGGARARMPVKDWGCATRGRVDAARDEETQRAHTLCGVSHQSRTQVTASVAQRRSPTFPQTEKICTDEICGVVSRKLHYSKMTNKKGCVYSPASTVLAPISHDDVVAIVAAARATLVASFAK